MELTNLQLIPIALLGVITSQILDVHSSGIKPSDFSFKKWANDNTIQLIAGLLCLASMLVLGEPFATLVFGVDFKFNAISIYFLGFGLDALTNYFARRKQNVDKKEG